MSEISLLIRGNEADLIIDFTFYSNIIKESLNKNLNILVNLNIKSVSIIINYYYANNILFSNILCEILEIIRRGNVRNIEFDNCHERKKDIIKIIEFLKDYYIDNLKFTNNSFGNEHFLEIINNFNEMKVNSIQFSSHLNAKKYHEIIADLCEKRQKNNLIKLLLLLIHRHKLIRNFPPRPVILMICDLIC